MWACVVLRLRKVRSTSEIGVRARWPSRGRCARAVGTPTIERRGARLSCSLRVEGWRRALELEYLVDALFAGRECSAKPIDIAMGPRERRSQDSVLPHHHRRRGARPFREACDRDTYAVTLYAREDVTRVKRVGDCGSTLAGAVSRRGRSR